MLDMIRFLVYAVFIVQSYAAVCEDVDTKACEILALKQPDLCSDPCLSKMCTRHCGHCPVKCYQCHEIDGPANCTHLVDCPSMDHYCYTTQTFTDDFTEVYKLGCAMKDICQQYLGPDHRKRNIDVNGACCMEDKCNNRLPLVIITGAQLPTQMPSGAPVSIRTDPTLCENLDDMACTRFAAADPNVCSNTCFATNACPRMCKKCFNCYNCNDIINVDDCNTTNVCNAGHECFTLETLSLDLKPVFRVGCMKEQLCSRFTANSGTIFGRRDGFALKGGCCKTDLCNDHVESVHIPTTTVAPTPTATGCHQSHIYCPSGFAAEFSSCYMIGPQEMTWAQAKNYCGTHCARLVDFSSRTEMYNVFSRLIPHHNGRYQDARVWTDATYSTTKQHWVWNHNSQYVDSYSFRHLTSYHHRYDSCAFAMVHTSHFNQGTTTEDVLPDKCNELYLPLCEATRTH